MKIAITGAGGTGKTTIAKVMSISFGLEYMKSPSRACFEKHGVLTEDQQNGMTKEARYALQMDIFNAIDKQVFGSKAGIFDRTHLDNLFYAIWQCRELVSNEMYLGMYSRAQDGLRTFDWVFFAPMYPWTQSATIDDGMRTQHLPSRVLMDGFIRRSLQDFTKSCDKTWYALPDTNVESRAVYIRSLVKDPNRHEC